LLLFIGARKDVSRFQRLIQGGAYFEMRWDVAAMQKANGQSVKALFNFA